MNPRAFADALRRASRSLRRRPGFFFIAVSSLAVALGLATAVIAEIDSLRHPYVPMRDAEQLYAINLFQSGRGGTNNWRGDGLPLLRATSVFSAVAEDGMLGGPIDAGAYVGPGLAQLAQPGFFEMLGVTARLGRLFTPSETMASGVAVVSDGLWRRYYGNRSSLAGITLTFNGATYRVVGVLPHGFESEDLTRIMLPASPNVKRMFAGDQFIARAKPGVDQLQVAHAVSSVRAELARRYATEQTVFHGNAWSLAPHPLDLRTIDLAMIGAAAFILIIACANVAALMMARGVANRRDQALRLALGATRVDLLRDVVAEISILAAAGGCLGLMIALEATGALRAAMPAEMSWHGFVEPHWNPRVFAGMLASVIAAVAIAAAAPAWFVTRIAPAEPLKEGSGTTTGRPTKRFQLLVVAELALSLVLLIGASLVARSVSQVSSFDFGYAARSITEVSAPIRVAQHVRVFAPNDSTNPRRFGIVEMNATDLVAIVARLRHQPGIRDAAWVAEDGAEDDAVSSDETQTADSVLFHPGVYNIGPGFMATLGLPIVAGRDFVDGDRDSSGAAILDQASARRLFPNGDAVGRRIKLGRPLSTTTPWIPVVGIARNALHHLPDVPEMAPPTFIYVSRLKDRFSPSFVIRGERGQPDVANAAVRTVRQALPVSTAVNSHSWAQGYEDILTSRRFVGDICATLSIAALILATAGLFGVLSYAVNQRMREFAVRVALGANRTNILRLVLRDGLVMALGGTAIGGLIGLKAGFSVYEWLWGVYPVDAIALITAESVLLLVTTLAMVLPAIRGARANPVDVMRAI